MLHLQLIFQSLKRGRGMFLVWVTSLALAVTGLLIVELFRQGLTHTLENQGRQLLGGDIAISARRRLTDSEHQQFLGGLRAQAPSLSEVVDTLAMIRTVSAAKPASRLANVHFVDDEYPLVGDLSVSGRARNGRELGSTPQAWISPDFTPLLGLKVGDEFALGQLHVKIVGLIEHDSAQTFRLGSLAPRVYVHRKYLDASHLVQTGSTLSDTLVAVSSTAHAPLKAQMEAQIPDASVQINVPEDLEQGSFRVLARLLDYLGLIGLITLGLGWIGVYYLGRRWLQLETGTVGVLTCLGLTKRKLRFHLGLKLVWVLFVGVILGCALATVTAEWMVHHWQEWLPAGFTWHLSGSTLLSLLVLGPGAGLLLLLPEVERLLRADPLGLLHGQEPPPLTRRQGVAQVVLVVLLFSVLALLQAHSWSVTGLFLGALTGAILILALFGVGLISVSSKLRLQRHLNWRWFLTLAQWSRRPGLTLLLVMVSGLSGLLAQLVPHIERTLVEELSQPSDVTHPDLFMIDIQDEQLDPLQLKLKSLGLTPTQIAPTLRARILTVNGQNFERTAARGWRSRESEMDARMRNRGVNLSYRKDLSPYEHVIRGKPWSQLSATPGQLDVSVEEAYAERLHLRLGDRLRFDLQGIEIEATVANLRTVDWDSFEPNFFIEFPDGVLNNAPKTWLMTLPAQTKISVQDVQAAVGEDFPGVTSINVKEGLDNATQLFHQLGAGLRWASGLTLGLGVFVFLLILVFQLATARRDGLQLRTLGLRGGELLQLQLLTYGGLALFGLLLGTVLALIVAAALAHFAFATHLRLDGTTAVLTAVLTLMAAMVGLWLMSRLQNRRLQLNEILNE